MRFRMRRARQKQVAELNVTAFMNLMVVLVPFLLMMAVFSRITVHELSLPSASQASEQEPPSLQLEVIMRTDHLVIADRRRGPLHRIPNTGEGYDLGTLGERLLEIKRGAPSIDQATILLEPQVDYQSLIWVMDVLRGGQTDPASGLRQPELFPQISIGDAPVRGGSSR